MSDKQEIFISFPKPEPGDIWVDDSNGLHIKVLEFDEERLMVYFHYETTKGTVDRSCSIITFCKSFTISTDCNFLEQAS